MTAKIHPLNIFEKETLKNNFKTVSALSRTIARSRLLPLFGFPLWLLPSKHSSLVLLPSLALVTIAHRSSWRFTCAPSDLTMSSKIH